MSTDRDAQVWKEGPNQLELKGKSKAELKNTRTAYANEMRSSITSALSTLSKDNQEKIDRYNELLKADEDTLIAN